MAEPDVNFREVLEPIREYIHESCVQREADLERQLADVKTALVALSPSLANDPRPTTLSDALSVVTAEYTALIKGYDSIERQLAEAQAQTERVMDWKYRRDQEVCRLKEERDALKATLEQALEALRDLANELTAGAHTLYQQKAILLTDADWLLAKAQKARIAGKEAG